MPSPFQNLAASTRQDYVTVVWRKAQKGTATSKWTCLPFRPYSFSGVVMLYPRCFIIWCWWELVNTWPILSYKVILIWHHLFNSFWSLPYPLDIIHWSCKKNMSFDEEVISVYIYQLLESYFNGIMVHCLILLKMLRAIVSIWRKVSIRGCLLCCVSIAPIKQISLGHVLWDFLVILNIQQLTQFAILLLSGLNTILWPKH